MKLHFYGADRCVTGSCHCLEINGKRILVDCGLQQGRDELDNAMFAFNPGDIDILLVTHAQTELTVACIGVIVAILTLIVLGLTSGKKSVIEVIKGVDYKTLLFFTGLFVSVAGLEKTGVLNVIANFITKVSGGSAAVIVVIILWVSAVTSAFVDNIPFAATMIPVIRAIAAAEGMDIGVLAWALSLGTDLGGNATPIGASANVVGTSVSAKCGYPISWGRYCKYCVPATALVMLVSTAYLFLRYL